MRSVHPRLCGEHDRRWRRPHDPAGSSPPVRGTLCAAFIGAVRKRFIPACAGNTRARGPYRAVGTVHPRLCGEHIAASNPSSHATGSSPPVRGTPRTRVSARCPSRFIPACAGNTLREGRSTVGAAVHPRLCGEHDRMPTNNPTNIGSSPPVRGTQLEAACNAVCARFIPACAGNTRCG